MLFAINKEINLNKNYLQGQNIETIYFGGGTPSLLTADELNRIFEAIHKNFPDENLKEITLEANPDDINISFLKSLKSTPVNRFSLGVQSFHNRDLKFMNRTHTASEADYAIKAAQDAGFENMSIDLIYGTPGMNDKEWVENIHKTQALDIPHISAYALTVEPNTALHYAVAKGTVKTPDNAQAAQQFDILMQQMKERGFDHYEISNFALPGKYAIHNTNYWMGKSYVGIGPSAHSYNRESRQWNIANNAQYIKSIINEHAIPFEKEILSAVNQLNEYIMISLRTMWGLHLDNVGKKFGEEKKDLIIRNANQFLQEKKMVQIENKLILTDAGKHFADRIASDLFLDEQF